MKIRCRKRAAPASLLTPGPKVSCIEIHQIHKQLEVSLANSIGGQRLQYRKERMIVTACDEDSHSLLSFSSRLAVATLKHYSIQYYIYILRIRILDSLFFDDTLPSYHCHHGETVYRCLVL